MSPAEIGLLFSLIILITILMGVHIAFVLIFFGFIGLSLVIGFGPAAKSVALIAFNKSNSYDFAVAPLFLLMSAFVSSSGIAKDAFKMASAWIGHFRGGLAMATTVACGFFAACSGSSLATAVAMGSMAYPEMKRYNYASTLSIGVMAAGGTLGILIPPSIAFILIGILTELSIGKLFIAGIIPGIVQILFYLVTIHLLCRFNPSLGPALAKTTFVEKMVSIKSSWPVCLLFVIVIGGLYGGIFTATEAGGVGAFGALVVSLVQGRLKSQAFLDCILDATKMTAMILALIIGAFIFNQFMSFTRIPFIASEYIVTLPLGKYSILLLILFTFIMLGMIFEVLSILVLTIPIVYPIMTNFGFDPIWISVLLVRVVEIGMISPPYGLNLFGLAGVTGTPISTIYKGVIPFLMSDVANMALLILVPSLSTLLPYLMFER